MKINDKFINLIKKRNSKAFESVYNEFYDVLFYTAFKIVQSKDDALDIVQDAFYKLWEKGSELRCDNHKSFVSWLITVTRNLSIDKIKSKKKLIFDDELVRERPDEMDMTKIKYNDFLQLCEGLLSEEEVDIVIYHAYYGKRFKEISVIFNKPISTISSKYYKAIKKVKEVLK